MYRALEEAALGKAQDPDELFGGADADGDGELTFEEFRAWGARARANEQRL